VIVQSARLTVIPCELAHAETALSGMPALGRMLNAVVADGFPVAPEGLEYWQRKLAADPSLVGWYGWFYVYSQQRVLIGDGGFMGPPNADGRVELGYAVVPAYRGQGFATEAAHALVRWAFAHPEVSAVIAHTLPDGEASMRVLKKLGMSRGVEHDHGQSGQLVQWLLCRDSAP